MSMRHDSQKCNFKVALLRAITGSLITIWCDPVRDGMPSPDALQPRSGDLTAPGLP